MKHWQIHDNASMGAWQCVDRGELDAWTKGLDTYVLDFPDTGGIVFVNDDTEHVIRVRDCPETTSECEYA